MPSICKLMKELSIASRSTLIQLMNRRVHFLISDSAEFWILGFGKLDVALACLKELRAGPGDQGSIGNSATHY